MFRSDRDALAQEVEELRQDRARLQAQNDVMRDDLLTRRQRPSLGSPGSVYQQPTGQLTPGERAALQSHSVEPFPVWLAVLLYFVTFGLFPLVHFSSLHDRLPRAQQDDPSAGKAIFFSFIPYFSVYWIIFNTLRLTDRINLQFRLRGLPDRIPRGLALAAGVLNFVPFLNFLGIAVVWPIAIAYFQRAANELATLPPVGAEGAADARAFGFTEPDQARMRVPLVRDLPGPDEVSGGVRAIAEEMEAEEEAGEVLRRRS